MTLPKQHHKMSTNESSQLKGKPRHALQTCTYLHPAELRKSLFSTSISGDFRGTQGNSEETPNLGTFCPFWGCFSSILRGFCLFRGTSRVKRPLCNLPLHPPPRRNDYQNDAITILFGKCPGALTRSSCKSPEKIVPLKFISVRTPFQ